MAKKRSVNARVEIGPVCFTVLLPLAERTLGSVEGQVRQEALRLLNRWSEDFSLQWEEGIVVPGLREGRVYILPSLDRTKVSSVRVLDVIVKDENGKEEARG